jgi:hypothetical protein
MPSENFFCCRNFYGRSSLSGKKIPPAQRKDFAPRQCSWARQRAWLAASSRDAKREEKRLRLL